MHIRTALCGHEYQARSPKGRTRTVCPACPSCRVDGCSKPLRARGLCSTHYNQKYIEQRHQSPVEVECAGCGKLCKKRPDPRRLRQYCTQKCRTGAQFREVRARKALVYVGPAWPQCELPDQHPARRPPQRLKPRVFVSGPCAWCGEVFTIVDQVTARYCSDRCSRYAARDRSGRFVVSDTVRFAIYERDGWVCQLCFEPVDPGLPASDTWAATLDHIVCQSWTEEPDHSPSNLRLAHRWCNSVRGDERYFTAADLAA